MLAPLVTGKYFITADVMGGTATLSIETNASPALSSSIARLRHRCPTTCLSIGA